MAAASFAVLSAARVPRRRVVIASLVVSTLAFFSVLCSLSLAVCLLSCLGRAVCTVWMRMLSR